MIAMSLEGRPVHVDLDCRLYFAQRRIGTYLDLLRSRPPHLRIVVARGLELDQRELLIVQDHRRGIMTGNQRIELPLVPRELAVQIERRLAQCNTNLFHLGGIDFVPFDEIEDGGVHALRSEEHTSELQSRPHLVCRLLLEKKKQYTYESIIINSYVIQHKSTAIYQDLLVIKFQKDTQAITIS